MDAHTSVICTVRVLTATSSSAARVSITRGGSTLIRPSGIPTGTKSQEQINRTGAWELDGARSSFGRLQPHRQTSPGGQQQHCLADSATLAQFRCSNPKPLIGTARHDKMSTKDRIG